MTSFLRAWLSQTLFIVTLFFVWGCPNDEAQQPPEVIIDTTACLGDVPSDGSRAPGDSCRALLSRPFNSAQSDTGSGCLIFRSAGEQRIVDTVWIDDRIGIYRGLDSLDLTVNSSLQVSFFLFDGEQSAQQCQMIDITASCDLLSGCLLKLGPDEARAEGSGNLVIDFADDSAMCLIERSSAQIYPPETCDGIDNDCDGRSDEMVTFESRTCDESITPNCARSGLKSCTDGAIQCVLSELADECNLIDEDCDGNIDEDAECAMCSEQQPCQQGTYCLDGTCVACTDNSHCLASTICKNNICQPCQEDLDCEESLVCAQNGDTTRCGRCDPQRVSTCGTGDICDEESLQCRGCLEDSECPDQVCVGGTCAECDPSPTPRRRCRTSAEFSDIQRICADERATGGTIRCRFCDPNAAIEECPGGSFCVSSNGVGQPASCQVCRPDAPLALNGCMTSQPICKTSDSGELACRSCTDGSDECGSNATCSGGRCEGCALPSDSNANGGSCPADAPICRTSESGNTCTPCENDLDCGRAFPNDSGRDTCANNNQCEPCSGQGNGQRGCDIESDRPICNANLCTGCSSNADCSALPNNGGRIICDTRQNQPNRCVRCVPGSVDECGSQLCGDDAVCVPCDDAENGFSCPAYFPGEREFCVNSNCSVCDPDVQPSDDEPNGCSASTPVCLGQPPRCEPCERDLECGSALVCVSGSGECALCVPNTNETAEELVRGYQSHHNRGCNADEAICENGRCRQCNDDADCGRGTCQLNPYDGIKRCRLENEQTCRSRGMLYDAQFGRCYFCENSAQCPPGKNCNQVNDGVNLCGGCSDDSWCGSGTSTPYCNLLTVVDGEQVRELPGFPLNLCRGCVPSDCIEEPGTNDYCLRDGTGCGVCDPGTNPDGDDYLTQSADGCPIAAPFCPSGTECLVCSNTNGVSRGCGTNERCNGGFCVPD